MAEKGPEIVTQTEEKEKKKAGSRKMRLKGEATAAMFLLGSCPLTSSCITHSSGANTGWFRGVGRRCTFTCSRLLEERFRVFDDGKKEETQN